MGRSILAVALACAVGLFARTSRAEPELALSLPEALARAANHAPDVVVSTYALREAQARRVGAGIVMPANPKLEIDSRPPITGGTIGDIGYAASLDFLFEVGGAPGARIREADRIADVARMDVEAERLKARAAAWTAYMRAGIASERIDQTRELIGAAERILEASEQRATAGAAGDIEQAIAAGDLAQLRAFLEGARRERESQLSLLRGVLDLPAAQPLALTTAIGDPPPAPPVNELVAQALRTRPELAQLRTRLALWEATKDRLSKERFPRVGGFLGIDAAPVSPIFGVVGVTVELPVAHRNQGPLAVVEATRAGDLARLDLEQRRIEREVRAALAAYEARRAELAMLAGNAVPSAARALELVEAGWRSGRFDVFRVATAARDVARVRGLRLDALEAAWLERIALDRATGGR